MATDKQFDESISQWLEQTAPARLPERVLSATFERTRRSRQQVGWRALLGRLSMPRFIPALGSATAVLIAAALAFGLFVNRPGIGGDASPTPPASPAMAPSPSVQQSSPPDYMWPQTSLEEVRQAQKLVGDPALTWQLRVDGGQVGQNHPCPGASSGCWSRARDGGSGEIFIRFLEEELGWEEFFWDEAFAHPDGLNPGDVVFVRCAPGLANPLYAADPERPGCAPTIDELRYQTVKVSVGQPDRQGPTGIWVVTGWEMIEPAEQIAPPSDAEITAFLEPFFQARIDGEGAENFADFAEGDPLSSERVDPEIPLLYATSTAAPYERSEFGIVDGPVWPEGWIQLGVRLFADNDETVVEQIFTLERDETGRLRLVYDFQPMGPDGPVPATTENGEAVPVEYGFLGGEVTYRATYPIEPSQDGYRASDRLAIDGVLPNDDFPRRVLVFLADPRPIGPDCVPAPPASDADALARGIRSDPDFEATAPVAVTIAGTSALQMDVLLAPGASLCSWSEPDAEATMSPLLLNHLPIINGADRARLYLIDLPGGSARVLAIAITADDDSFETVLEFAAPVIESIEFHAP